MTEIANFEQAFTALLHTTDSAGAEWNCRNIKLHFEKDDNL